jgi:archaetidylinositol phosphate synthase
MDKHKKARRVLEALTSPYEKPLLIRMAKALPAWVTPDHLTILGIIASFIIFAGLVLLVRSPWWIMLSNAGFFIHWWADSLDGTLARVRHKEREKYGYFVDHICDALAVVMICLGLSLSPLVHPGIGLSVAIGYLLMNVYAHAMAYVENVFRISYGRIGPTEIRIIFVLVTTLFAFWNPVLVRLQKIQFTVADFFVLAVGITFLIVFIVSSVREAIKLDRQDRAKWQAASLPDSEPE